MPEGPEIQFMCAVLRKKIVGKKLINIRGNLNVNVHDKNSKVKSIGSKGKLMWMELEGEKYIHIHFMLSGWIYFEKKPLTRYKFLFRDIKSGVDLIGYLVSSDNLAKVQILDLDGHKAALNKLGIDIFNADFTLEAFSSLLSKSRAIVANYLLNQKNICGIGNYIRCDALYKAGISPMVKCNEIKKTELTKLYSAIRYVSFSSLYTIFANNGSKYGSSSVAGVVIPKSLTMLSPPKKDLTIPYEFLVYRQETTVLGNKTVKSKKISGRTIYYVE